MKAKRMLVKFGGAAMRDTELAGKLFAAIKSFIDQGIEITFVHGGGPEIDLMLKRLAIEPHRHEGLRVTDTATMEVVEMVLAAKVNKALVSNARKAGLNAVGLSGIDAGIADVFRKDQKLGLVGSVKSVDCSVLKILQSNKFFPIICSIAQDQSGEHMNLNADELAAALAGALEVDLFVMVTDVPGLMSNYPDPTSVISNISSHAASELLESGKISSGMIPKVQACLQSLVLGARASLITDMIRNDLIQFLENKQPPGGTLVYS